MEAAILEEVVGEAADQEEEVLVVERAMRGTVVQFLTYSTLRSVEERQIAFDNDAPGL